MKGVFIILIFIIKKHVFIMKKIYLSQIFIVAIISCIVTISNGMFQKDINAYSLDVESLTYGEGVNYQHCLKPSSTLLSMDEWDTQITAAANGVTGKASASNKKHAPKVYVFIYECVGAKKSYEVCNICQVGTWMVIGDSTTPIRIS